MPEVQVSNARRIKLRHWAIMAVGCLMLNRCELETGGLVVSAGFVSIYLGLLVILGRSEGSEYACVFVPWDLSESLMAESILSGGGIAYHIENEIQARGALAPVADQRARFIVHASRSEEAVKLLAALRDGTS